MLAVFLAWPLVFGGGSVMQLDAAPARAETVAVSAVRLDAKPQLVKAAIKPAEPAKVAPPLSCYKRYEAAYAACGGAGGGACRMQAADHWDLCEATGFWPE
jgi:hypothetical protein